MAAGTVAMLRENQEALQTANLPSDLGTPGCCMQLHPDDVEELRIEGIALTSDRYFMLLFFLLL